MIAVALALAGWLAAALLLGLYLGERLRRMDAQHYQLGGLRPGAPRPAAVLATIPPEERARGVVNATSVEDMVVRTMEETGCTREEAERDVEAILAQLQGASDLYTPIT